MTLPLRSVALHDHLFAERILVPARSCAASASLTIATGCDVAVSRR